MIPIFGINLKQSEERWQKILRQFEEMGLQLTRFEAIDGRKGPHPLFNLYDDHYRRRWKGRPLSRGELGCFASHYLLWQECVQLAAPIFILEDDAQIEPTLFLDFLHAAESFPSHYECVRLFKNHSTHHKTIPVEEYGSFSIVKYTKGPMRSTGYYLTPGGASKFLRSAKRWFLPVDITMDRFWVNRVECYGMLPPCVSNDLSLESTIAGHEEKPRHRTFWLTIRREMFALKETISKSIHNARFQASLKRS
jgi:glycosyl transferase family 25